MDKMNNLYLCCMAVVMLLTTVAYVLMHHNWIR